MSLYLFIFWHKNLSKIRPGGPLCCGLGKGKHRDKCVYIAGSLYPELVLCIHDLWLPLRDRLKFNACRSLAVWFQTQNWKLADKHMQHASYSHCLCSVKLGSAQRQNPVNSGLEGSPFSSLMGRSPFVPITSLLNYLHFSSVFETRSRKSQMGASSHLFSYLCMGWEKGQKLTYTVMSPPLFWENSHVIMKPTSS